MLRLFVSFSLHKKFARIAETVQSTEHLWNVFRGVYYRL
jgi:hypothetical protein